MTSARTTLRRGAGLVALLSALLLVLTFMLIPAARAVEPLPDGPYPALVSGNPFCSDYGLTEVTRFDPVSGATGDEITKDGVTITVTDHKDTDEILAFTWTSTSWISAVIVKAGSDANIYAYDPSVTSGSAVTVGNAGVSHISFCLGEPPEEPDVTLVKAWQDTDGAPVDAPEGVTWEATLTLDDESSTILTVSDTSGDTDTTTTDDGTAYTVAEDDSSEAFDEVACSAAVQSVIDGTYGAADTVAYGLGAGAVDGDTVHVVCNTVPEPTVEPVTWDLTVEKDVVGDAGDIADFSFLVTCGEIEETLTIADGGSDAVTDIPEDTSCTVTEQDVPADAEVTITTSEDATVVEDSTITLDPRDTAITVSFVNTFEEDEPTPTPTPTTDVEPDEVVTPDDVEVLPNVVEKPAPTPAPAVAAADELPRTGLSSTQMLLLSLLLMGLGAVMLLGPEGRRES